MIETTTLLQIDHEYVSRFTESIGKRLDYEKIWNHFANREAEFLTDAILYMIRYEGLTSEALEAKLKHIGYTLRTKNASVVKRRSHPDSERQHAVSAGFQRSYRGGNFNPQQAKIRYTHVSHDVGITVDCIDRIGTFNKWILISGDGDFIELCRYLKKKGKKIEIWCFKQRYNLQLEMYADKIYFIDKAFHLSKHSAVEVFGFNGGGPA